MTYSSGFNGHADAKAAFQAAVDTWAGIVHSTVPIKVYADFSPLEAGVLGQAGPDGFDADPSLGDGTSYYPDALADALAGTNVYPAGAYDIEAQFNSTEPDVYFGTDGKPASNQVDFESIVLHELGHGLGFTGAADYDDMGTSDISDDTGTFAGNPQKEIFDGFLVNGSGTPVYATGSTHALATAFTSPVYWGGSHATAAHGGTNPLMYSPSSWLSGSSLSHFDEAAFGPGNVDSLMTPYLGNDEVVHRPGPVTIGAFRDLGWVATLDVPGKVTGLSGTPASGTVNLTWTAPPENGNAITGYTIDYTDNGVHQPPLTATGTSRSITGLVDGHTYVFTVTAANALGSGPASDPTPGIVPAPDTTAPTVTTGALPVYTLSSAVGIRYLGSDAGSGIASYDVRYRRAAFSGGFGALTYPSSWQATTATVRVLASQPGSTYCFSVRARDAAANTSGWSAERCTAAALDDRALAASTGWTRAVSSAYYLSTLTSTPTAGRTLTRTAVQARRVYLVATTCRGCGTVGVYWNGTLLRTVSLSAAATTYKHVISVKDFGVVRAGTLVIRTLNSARTYIDGVDLSRV